MHWRGGLNERSHGKEHNIIFIYTGQSLWNMDPLDEIPHIIWHFIEHIKSYMYTITVKLSKISCSQLLKFQAHKTYLTSIYYGSVYSILWTILCTTIYSLQSSSVELSPIVSFSKSLSVGVGWSWEPLLLVCFLLVIAGSSTWYIGTRRPFTDTPIQKN